MTDDARDQDPPATQEQVEEIMALIAQGRLLRFSWWNAPTNREGIAALTHTQAEAYIQALTHHDN